jgi:lipoprotein-anchoring transpeptidase ErfK/SrfK
MSTPSLNQKTVRPGSLTGYSYYYSNKKSAPSKKHGHAHRRPRIFKGWVIVILLLGVIAGTAYASLSHKSTTVQTRTTPPKVTQTKLPVVAKTVAPVAVAPPPNACASNTLDQRVIVSITERHLWACDQTSVVYDSPVVTGISYLAADVTPTGNYHVYAKETDKHLIGSDSTGSWDDYVYYWMPFLTNQYGVYGFHDATWRPANAFGNIDPDSSNASHGCVELPLATAKWLFNWVNVGTTVTINA